MASSESAPRLKVDVLRLLTAVKEDAYKSRVEVALNKPLI